MLSKAASGSNTYCKFIQNSSKKQVKVDNWIFIKLTFGKLSFRE